MQASCSQPHNFAAAVFFVEAPQTATQHKFTSQSPADINIRGVQTEIPKQIIKPFSKWKKNQGCAHGDDGLFEQSYASAMLLAWIILIGAVAIIFAKLRGKIVRS